MIGETGGPPRPPPGIAPPGPGPRPGPDAPGGPPAGAPDGGAPGAAAPGAPDGGAAVPEAGGVAAPDRPDAGDVAVVPEAPEVAGGVAAGLPPAAGGVAGAPAARPPAGADAGGGVPRAAAPGGGAVGSGNWIICVPLKPVDVGPLSCAGISSFRTYLSGSSIAISNSTGTRLLPCTRRVRPVTTNVFTSLSFFSPPNAWRVSASTLAASRAGPCPSSPTAAARHSTAVNGPKPPIPYSTSASRGWGVLPETARRFDKNNRIDEVRHRTGGRCMVLARKK